MDSVDNERLGPMRIESKRELSIQEIARIGTQAAEEVRAVLAKLNDDFPGVTEGLAAVLGSGVGAAGSLAALTFLGISGLSAAGITSGLATAGALIGGGMVAGMGVLAAPVAILGVAGYAMVKKRKNARHAAALSVAIRNLYRIQVRLMDYPEHFKDQIAIIRGTIEYLENQNPS